MSREKKAFIASVAVWAVCVVAVLTSVPRSEPEEDISPPLPEIAVEEPKAVVLEIEEEVTVAETATVEEELDKLPMVENATLTHYCICEKCCGKTEEHPAYGITASGREAEPYVTVAVDPHMIELGSTVYIDYGDGDIREYRADDTGSAIAGAKIDLCVTSHQEALELGVKTVKVWWDE